MSKESKRAVIAILATVLIVILGCAVALITPSKAVARDVEPDWTWRVSPKDTTNTRALTELRLQQLGDKLKCIGETETARLEAEQWEAEQAAYYMDNGGYVGSYGGGDWYADYSAAYNSDGPSRTMPGWHDGRKETYYSSNVLYHYRTNEWTPDEYGFYRTEDGYYVVASNEYEEGTVIETSRGEAMVLDGGCDAGYIDFYTNW